MDLVAPKCGKGGESGGIFHALADNIHIQCMGKIECGLQDQAIPPAVGDIEDHRPVEFQFLSVEGLQVGEGGLPSAIVID